jgi:maltose O-acetyltransferase
LRVSYLRHVLGIEIGEAVFIHMGARIGGKISVGSHSVIGRNCVLMGDITIGANVSITAETYIFTSSHIVNDASFACFYKTVVIEDYAWIGARAMILPGVRIGKGAVLAAASTATTDIPSYAIFAGSPAREVGARSPDLRYQLNYHPWFQ